MLPSRFLMGSVLLVLCLALAWQFGQRRGVQIGAAAAREEAARAANAAGQLQADEQMSAMEALANERAMLKETVRSLRLELGEAGRLAATERAELALYRRISNDSMDDDLSIDSLRWSGENPVILSVTLVQARGRDRIDGVVELVLSDDATAAETESLVGERYSLSASEPPATLSQSFDLRFFQTVEFELDGTIPSTIALRVIPSDGRLKPFGQWFGRYERSILD